MSDTPESALIIPARTLSFKFWVYFGNPWAYELLYRVRPHVLRTMRPGKAKRQVLRRIKHILATSPNMLRTEL